MLLEREETAVLPVIMITSSIGQEKTQAIEAGADDFIPKPFNHQELLTRVRSLLRIKRYHDTIKAQAAELLELNRTLEERVRTQVEELERLHRATPSGTSGTTVGLKTPVDVAPVSDADDDYPPARVVDLVDDPPVADTHAVVVATCELGGAVMSRLRREAVDHVVDAAQDVR